MSGTATPRPPARDWATDFDHLDPRWSNDPYPIWAELRKTCPIAHTERFQGCYFPSTYGGVRAVAYDTEHFSSRRIIVRDTRIEPIPAPPITADPPEHKPWKQAVQPYFTPEAIAPLEPRARAVCDALIDAFPAGGCDVAETYTRHIPVRVIAHMLGLPESDGDLFRRWIFEILELGISDPGKAVSTAMEMHAYFAEQLARRRAAPGDDLLSRMLHLTIDGRPADPQQVVGMLRLLLIAGIDTTWSAIGAALWHLAEHPEDAARLRAEPALLPTAIEELLRAYAPVTMAREVIKDTEIDGCPIKAGNMVLLSFPAANRDPSVFPEADSVVLDRAENRHAAFGLGIHRCVGSNLARMELTVAVETFLRRVPDFRLAGPVRWALGTVRGPRTLPMVFGGG
jgi:cytochrome P450